ncbi:MAG TPA: O-antigen ligase family protein [Candidatus Saccharimonadales bacterium]
MERVKQLAVYVPAVLIVVILALIPFHAFLTVWASSLVGHYTLLRLWKEFLVAICILGTLYIFFTDRKIRELFYYSRLIQLIILFLLVELIWGVVARQSGSVNTKALLYGWLSDCRYLVFFLVTLIIAKKTTTLKNKSLKLVIWPAAVVILFGLLQVFVLPRDFLAHFGYNKITTIPPYQTVNNNINYVRIISTLRGANPLGAYLLIPLSLATILIVRGRKVWQMAGLLIAGLIVMFFSYSRSAWIGLVVVFALSVYWAVKSKALKRNLLYIAVALVIVLGGIAIVGRNNTHVQNILFHTQTHTTAKTSSDQGHSSHLRIGIKQVLTEPLGKGPGTAGPASVYNKHSARIPENYYVQIGQEVGWLGLAVFLAINVLIAISLWVRRADTLSLALLASFIGLIVVNMLLEGWTDDTLSYLWWGLAGIAIATLPKSRKSPKKAHWIL